MENNSVWNSFLTSKYDVLIIGGGFTGLNTALALSNQQPKWRIVVLDALPFGGLASTNNAGFACFGSASEIWSDSKTQPRDVVVDLIRKRYLGIQKLALIDGIDAQFHGGYDVFVPDEASEYEQVRNALPEINDLVYESTQIKNMFIEEDLSQCGFAFLATGFKNESEFQINPGLLHQKLAESCVSKGIRLMNGVEVFSYEADTQGCVVKTSIGDFDSNKLVICTNGLTEKIVQNSKVQPARGQVIFAEVEGGFVPKGNFHATEGFYYFRNFQNGVLLGGGRQIDIAGETSTLPITTEGIQTHLSTYLSTYILPNQSFKIKNKWAGIMGFGGSKFPIVKEFNPNVYGAYAFGGMGVALSQTVAQDLSDLILNRM